MSMQITKKMTTKTTVTKTSTTGGGPPQTESHSTRKVSVQSSGGSFLDQFGSAGTTKDLALTQAGSSPDIDAEIEKIKKEFNMRTLMRSDSHEGNIKLDTKDLVSFMDKDKNKLNFNFDVSDFKTETLNVKTVGNKIEVHGEKISKTGGEERKEEYSRSYDLPSSVDAQSCKSSMFKDGVLTVELPVTAALKESEDL
nr:small heat shock protein [Phascolopsis gouldii]